MIKWGGHYPKAPEKTVDRAIYANKGRTFEDLIEHANVQYRKQAIAVIGKQNTKFIPLRDRQRRIISAKVEEKSTVDYLGRYKSLPVAVEAKHTEGKRISLARIEPHQANYLDDWGKEQEAIAIVLVSFELRNFYAIPWIFWKAAKEDWERSKGKAKQTVKAYGWTWETPGMASLCQEQLLPDWEIKTGGTTGLPYLEIIDRMTEGGWQR